MLSVVCDGLADGFPLGLPGFPGLSGPPWVPGLLTLETVFIASGIEL